ncbi:hypothetical protein K503DRAFT_323614 [Rhizopogon vinicolor AM-OR11-026]|uniref:Uncharacterized protein n=1 Tax=Rhizopogon vinicolor AM-OR11-026 TaxID=1314800 RepID=A0A1B7MU57_9AGAM|nr:hypothetical protein K503DRAFT_323614 [Rhizopogon vinicolor AM-OR11-026]
MSPHPSQNSPWPARTPSSSSPSKSKRKREPDMGSSWPLSLERRQDTSITNETEVEAAKTQCQIYANNDQVTCFPAGGSYVYQHEWAAVVWNSRRPQLTQQNIVGIYLVNADTNESVFNVTETNPTNNAGEYNAQVNDTWFGDRGLSWQPGVNYTYPFYWVITDGSGLDGSQTLNPTFTAIQTTYADAVVASSSAAASSSSLAAASSASLSSAHATSTSTPSGSVQQANADSGFPHWAIAVIVVLGFLAIVAGGVLVWLVMRRLRRREQLSNRGSMGSSSPMMANAQNSHSPKLPLLGGAGLAAVVGGRTSSEQHRPGSIVSPDGASEVSRAHSAGDSGPFSGADAAIMADAFRKALRKPDFAGPPVEEVDDRRDDAIMNRELKEEGRDLRSVSSSRGVRVETLGDDDVADTVQDH